MYNKLRNKTLFIVLPNLTCFWKITLNESPITSLKLISTLYEVRFRLRIAVERERTCHFDHLHVTVKRSRGFARPLGGFCGCVRDLPLPVMNLRRVRRNDDERNVRNAICDERSARPPIGIPSAAPRCKKERPRLTCRPGTSGTTSHRHRVIASRGGFDTGTPGSRRVEKMRRDCEKIRPQPRSRSGPTGLVLPGRVRIAY